VQVRLDAMELHRPRQWGGMLARLSSLRAVGAGSVLCAAVAGLARGHQLVAREQIIRSTADLDWATIRKYTTNYQVVIEQEPGSGGKESAEATIRNLAGHRCIADKVTGSKEVRAEPFPAQWQVGNIGAVANGPGPTSHR
jgi:hypothetical protein